MVRDVCNSISVRRPPRSWSQDDFLVLSPATAAFLDPRDSREHVGEPGIGLKEDGVVRRRWTVERKRGGVSER
jgi:hypothetical protein